MLTATTYQTGRIYTGSVLCMSHDCFNNLAMTAACRFGRVSNVRVLDESRWPRAGRVCPSCTVFTGQNTNVSAANAAKTPPNLDVSGPYPFHEKLNTARSNCIETIRHDHVLVPFGDILATVKAHVTFGDVCVLASKNRALAPCGPGSGYRA